MMIKKDAWDFIICIIKIKPRLYIMQSHVAYILSRRQLGYLQRKTR